jgi:transcriptional regulator with XRE-family HTH domain
MGRPSRTPADRKLMKEIGQRLRWVREAMGDPSQEALAQRVGVHQTAWGLYERGERMPDQFAALRMVAKLRVSIPYLMEGSLEGVDRDLAILLAARHPELAIPIDKGSDTDTDQA